MGRGKGQDSLHPLMPLRFSEFCSHADSPEGRGFSYWEDPREGSSPQGLRDSECQLGAQFTEETHQALCPKT